MSYKESFWNNKIISWDQKRYRRDTVILKRLNHCFALLKSELPGAHVLELGCGTGQSLNLLKDANIVSYTGIDISSKAIEAANKRKVDLALGGNFNFICADFANIDLKNYDLVISLGLLDWLNDDELRTLFAQTLHTRFFHSFSHDEVSILKSLHQIYVYLTYGHKNDNYVPRYFKQNYFSELIGNEQLSFISDPQLQFSQFLTNIEKFRERN